MAHQEAASEGLGTPVHHPVPEEEFNQASLGEGSDRQYHHHELLGAVGRFVVGGHLVAPVGDG